MNLKQLENAISVAENNSFTKAAEELYISQSSLSHSIQSLEEEIGITVFNRMNRITSLTPEGYRFIQVAKQILKIWSEYNTSIHTFDGDLKGHIALGASSLCCSLILPLAIPTFMAKYPNVEVSVEQNFAFRLVQMLLDNKIDIAILHGPIESNQIKTVKLMNEKLILITSLEKNFDLYAKNVDYSDYPVISIKNVANEKFVSVTKQQRLFTKQSELFKHANISPEIVFQCPDINTLIGLVERNIGCAIVVESAIKSIGRNYRVKAYSIAERQENWPLVIAHHKNKNTDGAIDAFINTACKNYQIT